MVLFFLYWFKVSFKGQYGWIYWNLVGIGLAIIELVVLVNFWYIACAVFWLISNCFNCYYQVIIQLVRSLDTIKVPAARAMIVWLLGEYGSLGEIIPRMLSTVLKYLAWCFTSEGLETKLQILNTITKVCH